MQKLENVLKTQLTSMKQSQQTGSTSQVQSLNGIQQELNTRFKTLKTTGLPSQVKTHQSLTGLPHGVGGVETNEIARHLAMQSVQQQLPYSMRLWLKEKDEENQGIYFSNPVEAPKLTQDEFNVVQKEMAILDLILAPAYTKDAELNSYIMTFLSSFDFGLHHDSAIMKANVDNWATNLERYPMYAIKRVGGILTRSRTTDKKKPNIADFIKLLNYSVGTDVYKKREMIRREYGI